MRFYFGESDEPTGIEHNNKHYYHYVEYGVGMTEFDDFVLRDSCGRMIPISVDYLHQLMNILASISHKQPHIESVQEITNPNFAETH